MAAQFDAASDRVSRASAPPPASGLTFTAWFRIDTDLNDFSTILRIHASGGGSTTLTIGTGSDGVTPQVFSAGGTVAGTAAVVGNWHRVGYTITGTSTVLYLAAATGSTSVFSGTVTPGATPDGLTFAGRSPGDADERFAGTLAYPRLWSGAVSNQAAVEAEWASATPVRASAWADWPLDVDLLDDSVNARHLTAGTTGVTYVTGPPLTTAITGSGAATTPTAVSSGTATAIVSASGSASASPAVAAGTGTAVVSGTGNATAATATASGSGTAIVGGAGAATAAPAVLAGTGALVIAGQGTALAPTGGVAGVGLVLISAAGAAVAPPGVASGVGGDPAEPTETPASRSFVVPVRSRSFTVPARTRSWEV